MKRLAGALLVLMGPAFALAGDGAAESPVEYDESDMRDDLRIRLSTQGAAGGRVVASLSNRVDDTECASFRTTTSAPLDPAGKAEWANDLSQKGSPERALYEWHLCFQSELDGPAYRGWRGFDPGPGGFVDLTCQVDFTRPPDHTYACAVDELKLERGNYEEYAQACSSDAKECRRFDTRTEFESWRSQAELTAADRIEIVEALLRHEAGDRETYIGANTGAYFVTVAGEDLPLEVCERLSTAAHRLRPGSEKGEHGGHSLSIGGFRRNSGSVAVSFGTHCGPLCASGNSAVARKVAGRWVIESSTMEWIS